MEYVESIIADVQRLGIDFKPPITYTSDYFPEMMDLAERLIKAGFLYADDTPVEQMREVSNFPTAPVLTRSAITECYRQKRRILPTPRSMCRVQ